MKKLLLLALLATLAACGSKKTLVRPADDPVPATPLNAPAALTSDEMIAPSDQARPVRSDEALTKSEKRGEDKFNLPPTR